MKIKSYFVAILIFILAINSISFASNNLNLKKTTGNEAEENIDVDLVKLKGTMLYSQLSNILNDYEPYLGKRIRYIGEMGIIDGENKNYYTVSCGDVTACCSASLEFILRGGSEKKEDYPEVGKKIRVSGVLEEYKEGKQTYLHLVNSDVYVFKDKK